ncbi:hypothetical protein AVEN_249384-1, partial [Araneus ventricosus]
MRGLTTESAPLSPCFCVTPAGGGLTNDAKFGAASILSGSSVESGFEHYAFQARGRDFTTWPPLPHITLRPTEY